MSGFPRLIAVADHALLIEWAEALDDAAHAQVLRLDRALQSDPAPGQQAVIPAYVSLLIQFDPLHSDHAAVQAHARRLMACPGSDSAQGRLREVQVCYDDDLAPDLPEVAARCRMTPQQVIDCHLSGDYRVYMYGFAPGYAYLGGVPKPLQLDRKPAPLRGIPAGSVIIAGPQCIVTTLTMPTGWWIIGRSPTRILDGSADRPFLFEVGDRVRFRRISRAECQVSDG
ncbi:MAG: allophanate hydrolase subunit 1 [Paracoccus sp. (in: a-proteobacteria)]|uniref:5-oxoprolinase subunit B family protein n=1 Tax=Paracoccus sp. TaxID=267 RepID=UPI0026DFF835|nr:allophanate hydrolase subunit 1 [Paracoccus sp. (in: a-proteobacteria)]MDO5630378.1 allophanate hydrolase subunit 1 [Paracoccus sp. (in: a-proteobacteria)]